ncbi:MAG: GNAT family N-acetyltransferase [Acidimicrobiales bacterium]|nr:GNAT family N-acetyltransferase [Acidimicrobiales bacterium]
MEGDRPVTHATRAETGDLAGALSRAFADDPVQQWLFDGADDVDRALTDFFGFFTEEYFGLGHVYVERGSAALGGALWAPPDRNVLQGNRIDDLLALVQSFIGDQTIPRLTELGRAGDHRLREPHFYLGILGVVPEGQGTGLGARLVEPVLELCDRAGLPAHLESSNPRNLGFYERLGFDVVDDYRCGPGGPVMTIMTRLPA